MYFSGIILFSRYTGENIYRRNNTSSACEFRINHGSHWLTASAHRPFIIVNNSQAQSTLPVGKLHLYISLY